MDVSYDFVVPSAKEYVKGLKAIKKHMNDRQRTMLERHFKAFNRSISFGDLAEAAGLADHQEAINEYENLGYMLGEKLNMNYFESVSRPGKPMYSSALGGGNPFRKEDADYYLVLHRELVEALHKVKWFT